MASPFFVGATLLPQLVFICLWHWREARIRSRVFKYFTHSPTDQETTLRITQCAVQLMLLAALGLAGTSALAETGTPQWKDTGPVTKKKQKEVNSGSWQPRAQPAPKEDQENPYNEGEDSETYDDGDT